MNETEIRDLNSKVPVDILNKIDSLFSNQNSEAKSIVERIFKHQWGVGQAQLARSLVYISNGDILKLKELEEDCEPRDIIMLAEKLAGNQGHFFIPTFDSIDSLI